MDSISSHFDFIGLNIFIQYNKSAEQIRIAIFSRNSTNGRVISSMQFQPDLVWVKDRTGAHDNELFDVLRGAGKCLYSNRTTAEVTNDTGGYVSAFNSNGFTLTQGSTDFTNVNVTGNNYVAWSWKAGGAVSPNNNTSGTITSTVSVNPTAGFSIVSYVANGTLGATVGHGLGKVPSFYFIKVRDLASQNWAVYHKDLGATKAMLLSSTNTEAVDSRYWNNQSPTSTVFSIGDYGEVNNSGKNYIAYCFTEIEGYSKFSKYTGNVSADGPFVWCGFRPRWIMIKVTDLASCNWVIYDTSRSPNNVSIQVLNPNQSYAEDATYFPLDILSNGFKIRQGQYGETNWGSGAKNYIFAAFAEFPFALNCRAR